MHPSSSKRNQGPQPSTSAQRRPRGTRELVECPICTMIVKDPKLLPCGHGLCGPQSEEKCLLQWEKRQEISGEIKCPICQKVHQMEASDALTPYGFRDLLENLENMRVCERHNSEIKFYCNDDKQEICEICWREVHLKHDIDLIEVAKCNKLSPKWERRELEDLRKLCLEAAEAFGEGADFLLGKQERYNKIADMCLPLQQKQPQIDEKFQRKDFDHDDEDIAEFEHYIEYIEKEVEKLAADLAKLDELSAELKRLTAKTAEELQKRQGERDLNDLNVEIEEASTRPRTSQETKTIFSVPSDASSPSTSDAQLVKDREEKKPMIPARTQQTSRSTFAALFRRHFAEKNQTSTGQTYASSPSTSTAPTARDRVETNVPSVQSNILGPTDTIIAFGDMWIIEIWRRGTNKWTEWEKGRDCGIAYACVKAHSTIYLIGGLRRGLSYSPETDIYDISREEWAKGPQLKVGRRRAAACFDIYNSQIIVVCGFNGGQLNSVEALKVDGQGRPVGEWEQIKPMMSKRSLCAAAILDDKLFVSGGYTDDGRSSSSVEMLDLRTATAEWVECAPMQVKRGYHAMIAFNNELFVFGGENGSNGLASCEKYSPINNTWQNICNMRAPRYDCGVCLMGDRIYVVGGWCDKDEDDKTVVYNPDRDEWIEGPLLTRATGVTKCVSW